MRLLYLNHNVRGTGTYLRALHLGRSMARRGHRVTLVTTSRTRRFSMERYEADGVTIVEAPDLWWGPARTGWDPWNALRRYLHLRDADVDLVHAFDGRPVVSLPGRAVARRHGVPMIMDWADWWGRGGQISQRSGWAVRTLFGPVETWFEEAFRPAAAAQTVISAALRDRAVALGAPRERVLLLHNGCETDLIQPMDRARARRTLGFGADTPVAVHLGVMTPADMTLLADAMRLVRRRVPDAQVVLVGNPRTAVPDDLLHAGTACVTGFVDDATKDCWLAAADTCIVALPDTVGNRGRWPSKVNDYFCAARATVMPDVGDAAALVRERRLGVVTGADAGGFADGIAHALASRHACDEAGQRARVLAETELAWPTLAERLDALYDSVTSTAAAARAAVS